MVRSHKCCRSGIYARQKPVIQHNVGHKCPTYRVKQHAV